mgnify:CR=1 FL=1
MHRKIAILAMLIGLSASVGRALPFSDNFEGYPLNTIFLTMTNGWQATTNTVKVQNTQYAPGGGSQAVILPEASQISNQVLSSAQVIWTEFQMVPNLGIAPEGAATNLASFCQYFSLSGFVAVANAAVPGGWEECTNSVLDPNLTVSAIASGSWVRVSIYENFSASNAAVFVDGKLLRQGIAFPGSAAQYNYFLVQNRDYDAYLDNFYAATTYPSSLASVDFNSNGVSEAEELMLYGRAAVIRRVGPGAPYATIQEALAAAENRDIIAVAAGTYAGNATCTVANITFIGGAFTNSGDLVFGNNVTATLAQTVGVGGDLVFGNNASATFSGAVSCSDDVSLGSGTVISFAQGITCDQIAVGAGGQVLLPGTALTANNLTIGSGGQVAVTSGSVNADSLLLTGTFTLTDTWQTQATSTLPFAEDFEIYSLGTSLQALGFRGWGATDPNAVVTNQGGSKVALIPEGASISNRIASGSQKRIWTDIRILARLGDAPSSPPTNSASLLLYFNSNGYLVVHSGGVWDTCDENAWNEPVSQISSGSWARVTIFNNFTNQQCALFLEGELLRQQLPFTSPSATDYTALLAQNSSDQAYVDDISIAYATFPTGLLNKDGDNYNDGYEIHLHGNTYVLKPEITIFRFR